MKKLLALVLALVMSMSLVTISNAAFSDAADIDYKEAVDVLAAVGVLEGSDGKFDPKAELTREQAAKIIAYLDLGKSTAEALPAVKVFNDVEASRWSAKFIAYCADAGYINGVGNGNFDPTGKLTGYAFGKLLLCALGYDATIEEMTGANWTIKVAKLMESNDITKDTSKLGSAVLTREEAAQYALNALKATMVDYENKGTDISLGDIGSITVGASKAKAVESKGEAYKDALGNAGTIELGEKLYGKDLKKDDDKKTDDFGRPATKWTYKNDEIGTYSDTADYVFTAKVTKKVLYNTVGKTVYDALTATSEPTKFSVTEDGKPVADAKVTDYLDKNSTAKIGGRTGNGTLTEVYVDDHNNVTIAIINTYVMQATDDYNSSKESLSVETKTGDATETSLDLDDWAEIVDFKEDDYILYTFAKDEIQTIAKAETVTGEVKSYVGGDSANIGGTTYKYTANIIIDDADHGKNAIGATGDKACVVLDAYGYIIYVDDAKKGSDDYVYVLKMAKKGDFGDDVIADAFFVDGTRKTITVDNDENFSEEKLEAVNGWYTFTEKKNGKYKLEVADDRDSAEATSKKLTENGKIKIADDLKATKSTTYIVLDDDDVVTVYVGYTKVPTITANETKLTAYAIMDGNYVDYVFIDASEASSIKHGNSSSSDLVYLIKRDNSGTDADENEYVTYKAIINGEVKTITLNDDADFDAIAAYDATKKRIMRLYDGVNYDSSTGYISDMDIIDGTDDDYDYNVLTDAEITYSNGVLTLGDYEVGLADSYKIYLIAEAGTGTINKNDDDYTITTPTASSLKSSCKGYGVTGNYTVVLKDDEAVAVYLYIASVK